MKKSIPLESVLGFILGMFIAGLLLMWYNYTIIQFKVNYWQWVSLSIVPVLMPKPLARWIFTPIGFVAIFMQLAKWIGLLTLPLIKL